MQTGGWSARTKTIVAASPPHQKNRCCACPFEAIACLRGSEFLKRLPPPALYTMLARMRDQTDCTNPIAETSPPHKARRCACPLEVGACLWGSKLLRRLHLPALSSLFAQTGGRTAGTKPIAATSPPHKARRCAYPLDVSASLRGSEFLKSSSPEESGTHNTVVMAKDVLPLRTPCHQGRVLSVPSVAPASKAAHSRYQERTPRAPSSVAIFSGMITSASGWVVGWIGRPWEKFRCRRDGICGV